MPRKHFVIGKLNSPYLCNLLFLKIALCLRIMLGFLLQNGNWNKLSFVNNTKEGGDTYMANTFYSREFKKMAVELIYISHQSTIKTANDLNIPLKTLEKWITAYNKNNRVFDSDYINPEQQIQSLKKRIAELETANDILKKTLGFYIKKNQ